MALLTLFCTSTPSKKPPDPVAQWQAIGLSRQLEQVKVWRGKVPGRIGGLPSCFYTILPVKAGKVFHHQG